MRRYLIVLAGLAVAVVGGVAFAQSQAESVVTQGCLADKTGILRIADVCRANETPVEFGSCSVAQEGDWYTLTCPDNTTASWRWSPDSDNDGVNDFHPDGTTPMDLCPFDTVGDSQSVNVDGCHDSDGDGVVDTVDFCPFSAGLNEPSPNDHGCPDSDLDGVYDHVDRCDAVPANTEFGCPLP